MSLSVYNISHRDIRQGDSEAFSEDIQTHYITVYFLMISADLLNALEGFLKDSKCMRMMLTSVCAPVNRMLIAT